MRTQEEWEALALEIYDLIEHGQVKEAARRLYQLQHGTNKPHPVFDRTWWLNNYEEGSVAIVFSSKERAAQRGREGGEQVEVRIVPVKI